MDKKSTMAFAIFFALTIAATLASYERYIVNKDITFFTEGFSLGDN